MSKLLLLASVAAALFVSTNAQAGWRCFPFNTVVTLTPPSIETLEGFETGFGCFTDVAQTQACNSFHCEPGDLTASTYLGLGLLPVCIDTTTQAPVNPSQCDTLQRPPNTVEPGTALLAADTTCKFTVPAPCIRTLCSAGVTPVPFTSEGYPPDNIPTELEDCAESTADTQFECTNNCVNYEQEIRRERTVYCVDISTTGVVALHEGNTCPLTDPQDAFQDYPASVPATVTDCPDFAGVDPCKVCCSSTIYNASVHDVEVAGDLSIKIITEKGDDGVKVVTASEETPPGGILAPIIGLKRAVGSILRGGL